MWHDLPVVPCTTPRPTTSPRHATLLLRPADRDLPARRYASAMPPDRRLRALLVEPVTRYQVRLVPVVVLGALVLWLVGAALWKGHWAAGLGALAVAAALAVAWTLIRRRRLQRYDVLPRSDRFERQLARRAERREAKAARRSAP